MDKRENLIFLPKNNKHKEMCLTTRCKCSQIKYENHTDKKKKTKHKFTSNLHCSCTSKRKLEAGKTIRHEKMNNIKVVGTSVNEHRRAWVVRLAKKKLVEGPINCVKM